MSKPVFKNPDPFPSIETHYDFALITSKHASHFNILLKPEEVVQRLGCLYI